MIVGVVIKCGVYVLYITFGILGCKKSEMLIRSLMGLSYRKTDRRFELPANRTANWERIYLEEDKKVLCIECRGRKSTGRPPKLENKVEKELIAEVQYVRAENAYLKN